MVRNKIFGIFIIFLYWDVFAQSRETINYGNIQNNQNKIDILRNYLIEIDKKSKRADSKVANIKEFDVMTDSYTYLVEWEATITPDNISRFACFYTVDQENKVHQLDFSFPVNDFDYSGFYGDFCVGNMTGLRHLDNRTYWYGDIIQSGYEQLIFIFPPSVDPFSNLLIYGYDDEKKEFITYADVNVQFSYPSVPAFEFCIYKGVRGFKVRQPRYVDIPGTDAYGDQNYKTVYDWNFYTWDKVKQKYIQTAGYPSEQEMSELKDLHGSPDFFAYIGLDFSKLGRQLVLSDVHDLTKAQLRIYRNAVYARHGRSFKSEDLQSLFNGYDWYKGTPDYTDVLLTDTDRENIKLIQKMEAFYKK